MGGSLADHSARAAAGKDRSQLLRISKVLRGGSGGGKTARPAGGEARSDDTSTTMGGSRSQSRRMNTPATDTRPVVRQTNASLLPLLLLRCNGRSSAPCACWPA
jgi:hypothetical protein